MNVQGPDDTKPTVTDPDATLLPEGAPAPRPAADIAPGVKVGRYTIIERIGAGAMGVVFSAWDPELDRRIALKLVHGDGYGTAKPSLLGEAKALAKLSHANVVTVFDVGTHGDAVFIAMEYLHGQTLGQWRRTRAQASWEDIVGTYAQAGSGLAAAHRAGLVHLDFKPANVMVSEGGEVKVLDFGLARDDQGATGRAGTPRYMAPEQHAGEPVGPQTDQFAFAVALYEALYGEHPFESTSMTQLAVSVQTGAARMPPASAEAPARLWGAISRGLSRDPSDRHPSMDALLAELAVDAPSRWRGWGVLAAAGTLGVVVLVASPGEQASPCEGAAAPMDAAWSLEVQGSVSAALRDAGLESDLVDRVVLEFDEYAQAWAQQRHEACEAAVILNSQSKPAMELRYDCLDRRLDALTTAHQRLTESRAAALEVESSLEQLPDLDRCRDLELLRSYFPPPDDPDARRRVREIRREADRIMYAVAEDGAPFTGAYLDLIEEADAIGHPPLQVSLRKTRGSYLLFTGRTDEGIELLREGARLGLRTNARWQTANILLELARAKGINLLDTDGALLLLQLGESIAEGLPDGDDLIARNGPNRTDIYLAAGKFDEAEQAARKLVTYFDDEGKIDEPSGVDARARLALVLMQHDKPEEASALLSGILDEPTIGAGHPAIARAYVYRARIRTVIQGDHEGALADHRAAYERYAKLYGEHHINAAGRLADMGQSYVAAGRFEEGRDAVQRAIEAATGAGLEPPNQHVLHMLERLGRIHANLGELDEAVTSLEEAERWGAGLRTSGVSRLVARGRIAEERGAYPAAVALFDRALSVATDEDDRQKIRVDLQVARILDGAEDGSKPALLEAADDEAIGPMSRARAMYGLALLESAARQPQTARRHIERAREVLEADVTYRGMMDRKLATLEAELPPASKRDE